MARRVLKIGIGLAVVAGLGIALVKSPEAPAVIRAQPLPTQAEVAALVDGDTFDVRSNDQVTRVRLDYVDTPVVERPGEPVTCLAHEASARLASVLPAGTQLKLTYGRDRFGRTTAEAVTLDGRLINAEVARSGLAQVVRDDAEDHPVPAAVDAAAREALDNRRGAHAAGIACTVPGRVKALTDLVARVPAVAPSGARVLDLATSANRATDIRMAAEELESAFDQNRQAITWLALAPTERTLLQSQVRAARDRAAAAETSLWNAANTTANGDATKAAANVEVQLIARTLAKIRKAEADRAAEAARRAAAAVEARAAVQAELDAEAQARDDKDKKGGGPKDGKDPGKEPGKDPGKDPGAKDPKDDGSKGDGGAKHGSGKDGGSDGGSGKKKS